MGSKRISVPEFDDFLPPSNSTPETEPTVEDIEVAKVEPKIIPADSTAEQTNSNIGGRKSLTEMLGMFFNAKEEDTVEEKPVEIVSSKAFLETLTNKKQETKPVTTWQNEKPAKPVESRKFDGSNLNQPNINIPKTDFEEKGFGTFKIAETEKKPYNTKPKHGKTLTEDEVIKQIKSLNIWSKPPALKCLTIEPYSDYYYVVRNEGSNKIGNNFVFDKTSGRIYVIASTLPPQIVLKKIVNQEIAPTY